MSFLRNSSSQPEIEDATAAVNDVGFHSSRGRFPFKRNPNNHRHRSFSGRHLPRTNTTTNRSHLHNRFTRKELLWLFPFFFFKGKSRFFVMVITVVFLFALASMVMQSSITSVWQRNERGKGLRKELKFGSTLKFVPGRVSKRFLSGFGLDEVRSQPRIGVRAPRIALVVHSSN